MCSGPHTCGITPTPADAKAAAPCGALVLGLLRGGRHGVAPLVRRLRLCNTLQPYRAKHNSGG